MKICSFLGGLFHSPISLLAIVTLIALAWSAPILCGEIHDAVEAGDLAKVKTLLKENPKLVLSKDANGWTPLHRAAMLGNEGVKDVIELLLANKADINARGVLADETPLHLAAWNGHMDAAKLLLANKPDVNARDNRGETPLHLAALKGHKDVAELLLAKEADVNARNNDGYTPLQLAAQKGYKAVVESLRQHGGSVDIDTHGKLPVLHPSGDYWERGNKKVKVEIAHCAPNRKFALVGDDSLYMLDDQNNILWSWEGPPITCMPIMDSKGTVYLLALDITWVALDSSNGKEKWRRGFMFMGSVVYSQITLYKDDMYFVVWDMSGYRENTGMIENSRLELCKGDLSLWSTEIPAYSTIHVDNGKVFYAYKKHGQLVKHEIAIPKTFPKAEPFLKERAP
jgi:ankyrin repeat protein